MQSAEYAFACRTSVQGVTGCGARQRNSPTGGWANGTPLKDSTASAVIPCNLPASVLTTPACANSDGTDSTATSTIANFVKRTIYIPRDLVSSNVGHSSSVSVHMYNSLNRTDPSRF